ncbi:hypothetical protein ABVN80_13070 [Acinetobacter baumannii]
MGGVELGYGSDLDLVFIHYLDEQADTDGTKSITGFELPCVSLKIYVFNHHSNA